MTEQEQLTMLKADLQMLTSANDDYLTVLLKSSAAAMTREGIANDESADYYACKFSYAAYLFRKRAANTTGGRDGAFAPSGGSTAMPRFLRRMMNNLVMSQKLGGQA